MRRARAGDRQAYQLFLEWAMGRIRASARKRSAEWSVGADEWVEDFVQEVILVIHQKRNTYDPKLPVEPWVAGIIRFKSIDHLRSAIRGRRNISESDLPGGLDQLEAAVSRSSDDHPDLETVLSELSERQRQVLLLTKVEGLSVREVAQRTGASESAIKVTVHRAMQALKKRFQGEGR